MHLTAEEPALSVPNKEALARKHIRLHYLDVINHHLSFSATSSQLGMTDGQRSSSISPNTRLSWALLGGAQFPRDAEDVTGGGDNLLSSLRNGLWKGYLCGIRD